MNRYRPENEVQKQFVGAEIKQKEFKGGPIRDHQTMVPLRGIKNSGVQKWADTACKLKSKKLVLGEGKI